MLSRQCLAQFGPDYRCVMQENHRGWHGDNQGTIWHNDSPGQEDRISPFAAEYAKQVAIVIDAYVPLPPPPKKLLPKKPPLTRKIEVVEPLPLIRELAAIEPLSPPPEHPGRWRKISPDPPASHHLLHPGAWMMQCFPEAWDDDYDPLLAAVHEDLLAAGLV